jgi:predicted neutral ceramidase superfamily lipid hydrolase
LLGAADTAWRQADASIPPRDSADVKRITAAARQALSEARFTAEFQRGRRLRPGQIPADG